MPDPTVRSRSTLRDLFSDTRRPSGDHFADFIETFISRHTADGGVDFDNDRNFVLPAGLTLGDSVNAAAGSLRFNGGQVQFNDGVGWNNLGSGGGAFGEVGGGPDVAFDGGHVGIGDFSVDSPTYRLEVNLNANTGTSERVRFGNAVLSNGSNAFAAYAQFSHQRNSNNTNFALRQGTNGDVNLNAPNGQSITISHNRTDARIFVSGTGQVVVGNNALVDGSAAIFQVRGNACKSEGGASWTVCSDARLKQDIRPFEDGLEKLMAVRPVRFRYNGKMNTNPEKEEVGILGQEMEEVFPYMIHRIDHSEKQEDGLKDLRIYNSSALTYIMVNAIQELAKKIQRLDGLLSEPKIA